LATKFFEESPQKMLMPSRRGRLPGGWFWVIKPAVVEAGAGPKIWARPAAGCRGKIIKIIGFRCIVTFCEKIGVNKAKWLGFTFDGL